MPLLSDLLDHDDRRLDLLRDGEPVADSRCVLLWVQRAQRANGNLAANLAVELADRLDLPVIAAFCLVPDYPSATLRAYRFMAEGLAELPDAFAARGIGWVLRQGDAATVISALVSELGAALVVTDQAPTRPGREWKTAVADRISAPMVAVDADVIVPTAHLPNEEWAPRTIRPKLMKLLDRYALPTGDPRPRRRSNHRESPDPLALVESLPIDRSVGPSPRLRGGQAAARARLAHFVDTLLPAYETDRNRSEIDGSSGAGPYLHFGQIAPLEIACAVRDAGASGTAPIESVRSYLDELLVQRELTINFALRNPRFDSFDAIPDWGRKTLGKHAGDPRPFHYDRATLDAGETHDPLWNAAQRQMVAEGFMPNRLRMYWAKQVLLWTASAEEAYDAVMAMNDRYFVCGRDTNGYAQVAWAIGGRHDRPFPPERPISGLVRPLGIGAMKKHFDPNAYIARIAERYGPIRTAAGPPTRSGL